ncbi:MAG: cation:dicarboxylase symporter family transporter [Eubacteriales bacterium]|nr:cation:dicarboxylase symporter family transporter [Eubacteriales bacterium]
MKQVFLLDSSGVDAISSRIEELLRKRGVNRENIIRLRLTMEEYLIRISKRYKGSRKVTLISGQRFGRPYLKLRYRGESYNPALSGPEDELTAVLLGNLGLAPMWTYRRGVNEICLRGPGRTLRSETLLGIAALLAIVVGITGNYVPKELTETVTEFVLTPVSDAFMNALNTFVGLLVFLSVVTGICSIGTIADFSRMGKNVIGCMVRNDFFATGLCIPLMLPFFRIEQGTAAAGSSKVDEIVGMLFSIFPSDPVTPFAEGSMLQIVFMAILTGCGLLVLGEQVGMVREFLEQTAILMGEVVQGVCRFLPAYIFTSIVAMLWSNGISIFVMLWKPIVIYLPVAGLLFAGKMAYTTFRLHISPKKVFSGIKESMLIGFTTCSSSAAFATMLKINEEKLGVSGKFSRFSTTLSTLLVSSTHCVIFAVILLYLAEYYGTPVNFGWLVTAWLMCSIFGMTIPPVSGGMLIVTGILMVQLGVPKDGLAVAGLLGMILDFAGTGVRVGICHLEILLRADHLKMWDRSVLEKD